MTLFAEIQAKLRADPRVTTWFNEPWIDGVIDGHQFIARVLEPGICRTSRTSTVWSGDGGTGSGPGMCGRGGTCSRRC